jgi:4-amino-4-deoxy-L-arabinose transferase-like glycosyltransferase
MKLSVKFPPTIIFILFLSLVASVAIYFSTVWGPWAFSDSTEYIVDARNFLAGRGLGFYAPSGTFERLALHPPLYPLVLSIFGYLGFDLIQAARWLNIILFGALTFLVGTFTYRFFNAAWFALVLCAGLLTLPPLVDVFSGAMSEPLFFFTGTIGICLLTAYLKLGKRYLLTLASISISLAFLDRFPGVMLVIAGVFGLFVVGHNSLKQRLRDIFIFNLISITPTVAWITWIYSRTQTLSARKFHFTNHIWSGLIDLRKKMLELFWSWLPFQQHLPAYSYNLSRNILIALIILLFIPLVLILYRNLTQPGSASRSNHTLTFVFFWFVFMIGYIVLLASSFVFTSPLPDLIPRTLLPVQFALIFVLLALLLSLINEFYLHQWAGWVCAALALIIIIPNSQVSWNLISEYHQNGAGSTSKAWHTSLTLQALNDLPAYIPIITNQAAAVLLLTDRAAYDFCYPSCNQSGSLRYGDDPADQVQQIFRERGAALVLFYPYCGVLDQPWYVKTLAQVETLTQNLSRYFSSCDGAIYFYPSASLP